MAHGPRSASRAASRATGGFYSPQFSSSFFLPRYWGTWLALGLIALCAMLPLRAAHVAGAALGLAFYAANKKRRRIARINIDLCFPRLAEAERARLVRRHFIANGRSLVDLGRIWWAPQRRLERLIRVKGLKRMRDAFASGRNVILLTGHFVTADLGGIYVSKFRPGVVMMKQLKNPVFNWFVWRGRTRFGARTTLRAQGLRPLIRAVKAGMFCYYVPDEDFGARQSVFVPLLGVPTATITVLGRLARLTDAVVLPCVTRMLPKGAGYELIIRPPLRDFPTGDRRRDAERMNQALEEVIRLAPELYNWTFKWFRTRPKNAPPPY